MSMYVTSPVSGSAISLGAKGSPGSWAKEPRGRISMPLRRRAQVSASLSVTRFSDQSTRMCSRSYHGRSSSFSTMTLISSPVVGL